MEGGTFLDSAVFQLTPTRTRCELVIWSGRMSLKLASGLVKPFVCHLRAAEEQFDKGGYSIILEVPAGHERSWFTKGTVERFVRFVSTPEVLERVDTIEHEILQIAESISAQCRESLTATDKPSKSAASGPTEANKMMFDSNPERAIVPFKPRRESVDEALPAQGENSKIQLIRVLENRKMVLQKEQGMAYARAAAAGFDTQYMADLVSFAELFGAFRLRKACLNIMDLRKRKQEAGVWLEMELNTIEDSSVQAETPLVEASGIILTDIHPAYDDPSKQSSLSGTVTMPNANGHHANSNHNKDNGLSTEEISARKAGGTEYLQGYTQQSTVPAWPTQPPQYMQNFQSHIAGPGAPLQGFHGLPMQSFQLGSPYYQSYTGNPYWPQHFGDPRFGPAQRTESSGLYNVSAGLKQNAAEETEVGSSKSVSRSQSLTDKGEHSELEGRPMVQHSKTSVSPCKKSSSRRRRIRTGNSGNKRSGMVVIRNINYITSKGNNGIAEEDVSDRSNSESDSDSGDDLKQKVGEVVGLSGKNQKHTSKLSKRKGYQNMKDGEHELSTENEGVNDENSSWQLFQKCLLRDDESSENKPMIDNNDSLHAVAEDDRQKYVTNSKDNNFVGGNVGLLDRSTNNHLLLEPGMGTEDHMTREDTGGLKTIFELEAISGKTMLEIKKTISDEKLVLPERANSTMVEKDAALTYQREQLSIHKRTTTDDSFIVSKQHTETELAHTDSQWGARVDVEHTITENSDQLRREKSYGRCLVDDSFMVPTRSTVHDHVNREWRTDINMDSELTSIDKAEHPSYNVPKNKSETSIIWEPAELFMIPERNSERDSLSLSWNPVTDNDPQVLVNNADKMYLDEECNGQMNEQGSLPRKHIDKIVKELPGTEMGCKDGQLKAIEVPAKKRAEMTVRGGKSTKSTPLAEAQLRAQQLRSFKAGLQKTKKEKEEEERKRIEDLKTQRQQRIAGRTTSSVNKLATTNSHLSRQQQLKSIPTSKLSLSFQKSRTTPRLSTARSLPGPVKKVSNEAINRLSSHKQVSSHLRDTVSQSISSKSGVKGEKADASRQTRLVAPAKHTAVNVNMSSKQVTSSKTEISGKVKANGKSAISSNIVTKVSTEKAMDSNGSNILNKENGSISNVKKNSNQALVLQMGKQGNRLKADGTVSRSTANDLDNLNSKKNQSLVAKKIALPVSKLNGGSIKVPLDLKSNQTNHPDSAAMQALCNGEESNLDTSVVHIKSKENTGVHVTEKHINNSKSQNEENSQPLKSDYWKTVEDKEQVKGTNLDYNSGKRREHSINSGDFATRDSNNSLPILKLDRVQQSRDYHATRVEGLVDEGFEIVEVTEDASTPLTEMAMSNSPNSRQLDVQPDGRNSFQASSFKLQRCDIEEPSEATVVHASSLDGPASNSFEFRLTAENNIACEEICTPKASIFEFGSPLAIAFDSPTASPQLQNVPKLPPSASPVTDDGNLDSAHSRRKWGNSENTAKGLRRLLMFGRKSRTSQAEKDVDSSRGLVSV